MSWSVIEAAALVTTIVGILSLFSIGIKFAWSYANTRWSAQHKDYMSRSDIKGLVVDVLKEQAVVTWTTLPEFCTKSQGSCPKGNEVTHISTMLTNIDKKLTDFIVEQKTRTTEVERKQEILRQNTLPKEYQSKIEFDATIKRIEDTFKSSIQELKECFDEMEDRLAERGYARRKSDRRRR